MRLEELTPGVRVTGILSEDVRIVAVQAIGDSAVEVTYKDAGGQVGQQLLYRGDTLALLGRTEAVAAIHGGIPRPERALHREMLSLADVDRIRMEMEEAQARRLQPHFIRAFFAEAFARLGGRIGRREEGRYEISYVPPVLCEHRGLRGLCTS